MVSEELPSILALEANSPNPFNPATAIAFMLPEAAEVRLAVYDALGRAVRVLVEGVQAAGSHTVSFEAADLPSGVYFYRLKVGGQVLTRRMTLLK